jgi:hypothetical protein
MERGEVWTTIDGQRRVLVYLLEDLSGQDRHVNRVPVSPDSCWPGHAVCAGPAKPDHPQLCVTSDLMPRDVLWRQRESPLRTAICRDQRAGWY